MNFSNVFSSSNTISMHLHIILNENKNNNNCKTLSIIIQTVVISNPYNHFCTLHFDTVNGKIHSRCRSKIQSKCFVRATFGVTRMQAKRDSIYSYHTKIDNRLNESRLKVFQNTVKICQKYLKRTNF